MKKVLIGATAIAALIVNPALAADMGVKAPPPEAYFSWTGFYVGVHAGWEGAETLGSQGGVTNSAIVDFPINTPTDQRLNGWLAGGQFGYNFQIHRVVIGIDFSGSWDSVRGQSTGSVSPTSNVVGTFQGAACFNNFSTIGLGNILTYSCNAKQDWTVQILPKLGYTFADGRFLPYVTGGVALTELTVSNATGLTTVVPIVGQLHGAPIGYSLALSSGVAFNTPSPMGYHSASNISMRLTARKISAQPEHFRVRMAAFHLPEMATSSALRRTTT